ncbi:hypothetical protein GE061_010206 [Apolygus lucorum]|uniref:Uncharacterized protein n=1 Tax=Apolygus lucorum TaxID=248454 RepID=A0A6A4KIW1_APOLU|nr:hypothetical protein GE061_010206 [Apolygus lucorum]
MDLTTGQRAKDRPAKSVFSIRNIVDVEEDPQPIRNGGSYFSGKPFQVLGLIRLLSYYLHSAHEGYPLMKFLKDWLSGDHASLFT